MTIFNWLYNLEKIAVKNSSAGETQRALPTIKYAFNAYHDNKQQKILLNRTQNKCPFTIIDKNAFSCIT